ncbi:hypothetical protein [Microcoleus anatoxicus]|uniref:Uncharacterized protein n=1 Tax=Microcoleus anatoxicus PTRS2 TaxID=2705321 RepID=A0ABU8YW31_9CYAN
MLNTTARFSLTPGKSDRPFQTSVRSPEKLLEYQMSQPCSQ